MSYSRSPCAPRKKRSFTLRLYHNQLRVSAFVFLTFPPPFFYIFFSFLTFIKRKHYQQCYIHIYVNGLAVDITLLLSPLFDSCLFVCSLLILFSIYKVKASFPPFWCSPRVLVFIVMLKPLFCCACSNDALFPFLNRRTLSSICLHRHNSIQTLRTAANPAPSFFVCFTLSHSSVSLLFLLFFEAC